MSANFFLVSMLPSKKVVSFKGEQRGEVIEFANEDDSVVLSVGPNEFPSLDSWAEGDKATYLFEPGVLSEEFIKIDKRCELQASGYVVVVVPVDSPFAFETSKDSSAFVVLYSLMAECERLPVFDLAREEQVSRAAFLVPKGSFSPVGRLSSAQVLFEGSINAVAPRDESSIGAVIVGEEDSVLGTLHEKGVVLKKMAGGHYFLGFGEQEYVGITCAPEGDENQEQLHVLHLHEQVISVVSLYSSWLISGVRAFDDESEFKRSLLEVRFVILDMESGERMYSLICGERNRSAHCKNLDDKLPGEIVSHQDEIFFFSKPIILGEEHVTFGREHQDYCFWNSSNEQLLVQRVPENSSTVLNLDGRRTQGQSLFFARGKAGSKPVRHGASKLKVRYASLKSSGVIQNRTENCSFQDGCLILSNGRVVCDELGDTAPSSMLLVDRSFSNSIAKVSSRCFNAKKISEESEFSLFQLGENAVVCLRAEFHDFVKAFSFDDMLDYYMYHYGSFYTNESGSVVAGLPRAKATYIRKVSSTSALAENPELSDHTQICVYRESEDSRPVTIVGGQIIERDMGSHLEPQDPFELFDPLKQDEFFVTLVVADTRYKFRSRESRPLVREGSLTEAKLVLAREDIVVFRVKKGSGFRTAIAELDDPSKAIHVTADSNWIRMSEPIRGEVPHALPEGLGDGFYVLQVRDGVLSYVNLGTATASSAS